MAAWTNEWRLRQLKIEFVLMCTLVHGHTHTQSINHSLSLPLSLSLSVAPWEIQFQLPSLLKDSKMTTAYFLLNIWRKGDCDGNAMPKWLMKNFSGIKAAEQSISGSARYICWSNVWSPGSVESWIRITQRKHKRDKVTVWPRSLCLEQAGEQKWFLHLGTRWKKNAVTNTTACVLVIAPRHVQIWCSTCCRSNRDMLCAHTNRIVWAVTVFPDAKWKWHLPHARAIILWRNFFHA